jgi:heterodisulfide reductase subunit A-like polyferredoxin
MKSIITLAGILLIATGCYFIYDGYQVRQTAVAQVEQGISSAIRAITDNTVKTKTNINNESAIKMIGGGVAGITGLLLLVGGLRPGKKRR